MLSTILIMVIAFALVFEFINGFHDTANAIATAVYTKALTPGRAIALAAFMNLIGAMASEKVAGTISKGLVDIQLEQYVILAALIGAIIWNLFTWWMGIPSSSSHALIGSLVGAVIVYTMSTEHIIWTGVLTKVIIPLFTSPLLGLLIGFLGMKVIYKAFAKWSQSHVNRVFIKLQVISSAVVAFSHGNNDAQKTMGIITLALVTGGLVGADAGVPLWVKISCAVVMAAGTSVGGWKVMKTMGAGVTKINPASGFVAQTSSAIVIELMTFLGAPVSTTQVITTSIMGVGSARRKSAVKWGVAGNIFTAWIVTLPVTMVLGGIMEKIIGYII
ncbi:MAG: inorganic phosphate transporter [Bacillota bacterium]|nr:inorganic phosphate transporter [Clostridiales bacterium]MCI7392098.1 inorganic phosphate transporter [Clostridiales bacterium]MDD6765290.1 inorganic phosphate transporter [Bacillota bacterium]MDO4472579.1 inorganic phosphate transporter [Bacillota bacterium]